MARKSQSRVRMWLKVDVTSSGMVVEVNSFSKKQRPQADRVKNHEEYRAIDRSMSVFEV